MWKRFLALISAIQPTGMLFHPAYKDGRNALPQYGGHLHDNESLMPRTPMYGLMARELGRDH
jgi:hypothetical protein